MIMFFPKKDTSNYFQIYFIINVSFIQRSIYINQH